MRYKDIAMEIAMVIMCVAGSVYTIIEMFK